MDTDLVELMRRIIMSIEGGLNEWNSESFKTILVNEEAGHGRVSIIFLICVAKKLAKNSTEGRSEWTWLNLQQRNFVHMTYLSNYGYN